MTAASGAGQQAPDPVLLRRRVASTMATASVMVIVGSAVALVVRRLVDLRGVTGEVELRASDGLLVAVVLLALLVVGKIVSRSRTPSRLAALPRPVRNRVRRLVETSHFGVGSLSTWTATNPTVGLDRIELPASLDEVEGSLGTNGARPRAPDGAGDGAPPPVGEPRRSRLDEPALELDRLGEHVVQRGETFWSLAEATLGDGRRWTELRDANLGREVRPGWVLGPDDILLRGWSILVPLPAAATAAPEARREER